jgi:RNA recognition motif-containing protein
MKKLYVGNLPHSYSEEDLKQLFSKYSSVISAKLIIDRDSGRSKGFGFVEFENSDEADEAIAEMHGQDAGGRELVVNEARPQVKRDGGRPSFQNKRRY